MRILSLAILALTLLSSIAPPVYTKEDLTGEINPQNHHDFTLVPASYANSATYIRKEVSAQFIAMAKAAQKDGIRLVIVSGTRSHRRQAKIWEAKWNSFGGADLEKAKAILQYSSMPGTSRHHWGTDIDINTVEASYFETSQGKKVYSWLTEHAWEYGFFQPYNKIGTTRNVGYKEEKWHWSYFPCARMVT